MRGGVVAEGLLDGDELLPVERDGEAQVADRSLRGRSVASDGEAASRDATRVLAVSIGDEARADGKSAEAARERGRRREQRLVTLVHVETHPSAPSDGPHCWREARVLHERIG